MFHNNTPFGQHAAYACSFGTLAPLEKKNTDDAVASL